MNPVPGAPGVATNSRPAGSAPVVKRKKPLNDPFFKGPKKPTQVLKTQPNGHPTPPVNGQLPSKLPPTRPLTLDARKAGTPTVEQVIKPEERVSGFSDPKVTAEGIPYKDYKLVTTKGELLKGLRYHLLQVATDKPLDIRNEDEFPKPARLHRRDPRASVPGQIKEEVEEPRDGLNSVEREELNKRKEARQKEREANLAQIAPSQGSGKKMHNFKKKTQQVFRPEFSTEEKRRIQTNYEEKLPWHLEDFDNKHCLVGHYQVGGANVHAALVLEPANDQSNGRFRLIPVEKVYQFKPKRELPQGMTIEEVEAAMKKRGSEPEWLIRQKEARIQEASRELATRKGKGLFSGAQTETIAAGRTGEEADLDFEDDFADDEEGDLFEVKDEDAILAEKKIKEDQLTANFLDFKDLKEYDEAEEREKREAEARKKNFKELRKALERRERNYNHGSDSEYESSTDSEEERDRIERERLANIKKEEEAEGKKSSLPSGANTPSGRKEKQPGTASDREGGIKKSSSSKSLKRPGSPNLSDASGTDASSRKKKLKSRHLTSNQPTPGPSRPLSPANVPSSSQQNLDPSSAGSIKPKKRMSNFGGAGSDTDTGVYSDRDGGAMSDGSKARRLKLKMSSSPPPTSATAGTSQPTSRAGSPGAAPAPIVFPSVQDIKDAIPTTGISIKDLMKIVAHPKERRADFVALVKEVAKMDKERGVLVLK